MLTKLLKEKTFFKSLFYTHIWAKTNPLSTSARTANNVQVAPLRLLKVQRFKLLI